MTLLNEASVQLNNAKMIQKQSYYHGSGLFDEFSCVFIFVMHYYDYFDLTG